MSGLFGGGGGGGNNTTQPMEVGLRVQTSAYGMAVPIIYGRNRVTGNLIWYGAFTPVPHTTTTGGGGGKGGSSSTSSSTSYTYTTSFAMGLGDGQFTSVNAIWVDNNYHATNDLFTFFNGSYSQTPWSYLTSNFAGQDLAYRGIGYVAAANYNLNNSSSLPRHSFDVTGVLPYSPTTQVTTGLGYGTVSDANPKDVLVDFLTNANYGAGFPSSYIGDLTNYSNYCIQAGLFLSPVFDNQTKAADVITQLMLLTNSAIYYSEGVLKIVPYADENVGSFTPNTTVIYDLSDDDFIADTGQEPILIERLANADAYNQLHIEFADAANSFNPSIAEAKDQANIDTYGLRPQNAITAHEITNAVIARNIAQLILQRTLYVRNTYTFTVGIRFALLEPTDLVSLTDSTMGYNKKVVRITEINEQSDGTYQMVAEDYPKGSATSTLYPSQSGTGYTPNYAQSGGDTNAPVIFEPPDLLAINGLEIWIGASGGPNWGGCQIWISYDGTNYSLYDTITGPARQGFLTTTLASGSDPDTAHALAVDLTESRGQLLSVSQADADAYNSLLYVDGELISYETASLTSAYHYNLSYLRRGAYGTTIGSHAIGSNVLRLDNALVKIPFTADRIGQSLYVKLPSFNVFGIASQDISTINPIIYKPLGSAYNSPLPDVSTLTSNFISGLTKIYWHPVVDFRQPAVDYEIRVGAAWSSAQVFGRTPLTEFVTQTDGTYWIAAHYLTKGGYNTYSLNPVNIVISGSSLQTNVIANFNEAATGWSGTLTNLVNSSGALELANNGTTVTSTTGTYDIPSSHIVNIGRVAPCLVSMNYTVGGVKLTENILTTTNVFALLDILDSTLGVFVDLQPQIAIADTSGTYGAWQNYQAGTYNAQYFKVRFIATTSDVNISPFISGFSFSVDVPDRVETGTLSVSTTGTSVVYSSPFNGGTGANSFPLVQITQVSATQGDTVVLTAQSNTGFTIKVLNGGVGVARTVNYTAQGY